MLHACAFPWCNSLGIENFKACCVLLSFKMGSLKPLVSSFFYGLKDSILGVTVLVAIDTDIPSDGAKEERRPPSRREPRSELSKKSEQKVLPKIGQCCLLNGGIFLLSVLIFENYFIPCVRMIVNFILTVTTPTGGTPDSNVLIWIEPTMAYTFRSLWVIPLFWLSKLLNSFWFLEIADVAYRRKLGRPMAFWSNKKEGVFKVVSKLMADFLFSITVEILFLLQARAISFVPIIGPLVAFVHMSLLYSLYAFEYTWTNLGWNVVKRVSYIENHWPYFTGFGLVLTLCTSLPSSSVISACIFGILFPLFILSGLEAKPVEEWNYPIRLFSLAIWLTNKIFTRSRGKVSSKAKADDISRWTGMKDAR